MKWGLYFSHDDKNTALYSNDGGSGCTTCGYTIAAPSNVPIGVFDAGSNFLNGISGSGNLLTKWLTFNGDQLFDAITAQQRALNPNFTFAPPMVNDTDVVEQVQGAYLEGEFGGNFFGRPMKAVLGARVETTFADISGLSTNFNSLAKILTDPTQYQVLTGGTGTVGQHNHYTDILPNFSLRWDVTDQLVTRAAASQTITRPTLEDLSPVTTLVTLRPGNFAASSGNANLKPFKSNNLDLSVEYYYGKTNYISLGGFYKDVTNFIVLNQHTGTVASASGTPLLDPATGLPAQFSITAPVNGQEATVKGIEAAYQQALWDTGVGFQVNGTFAETDHNLDTQNLSNKFAVTGLSSSANAVLYYDKGPFEARMAYNWRDKFLQYLAPPPLNGAGQAVTQVRPRYQLDFGSTYHLTDYAGIFFNVVNITNTPLLKYAYYGNQFLYAEDSGVRFNFGVRANF
jgi:TonB-dependent receptor